MIKDDEREKGGKDLTIRNNIIEVVFDKWLDQQGKKFSVANKRLSKFKTMHDEENSNNTN